MTTIWERTLLGPEHVTDLVQKATSILNWLDAEMEVLCDDPMTSAMGAPVDDIYESWRRKHIVMLNNSRKELEQAGLGTHLVAQSIDSALFDYAMERAP